MIAYVSSDLLHGPDKTGAFIAEASELGFKPGQWPRQIRTKTRTFNLTSAKRQGGDLAYVVYLGEGSGKLTVVND